MTYYIFKDGNCIGSCDFEPNSDDLASRGERAVFFESTVPVALSELILDTAGEVVVMPPAPSKYHVWDERTRKWTITQDGAALVAAEELAAAKAAKVAALNAAAQCYINKAAGIDALPDFEVRTWTLQALEAKAWAADKTAKTPTLDAIASARGIPADKLKSAALRKALAFEALTARTVGIRQAIEVKINTAANLSAVAAIEFSFGESA